MATFARAFICGNLTRDPEVRYVGNNQTPICQFSLAVNDKRKQGDDWIEEVSYIDINLWSKTAEYFCESAKKGMTVTVEGRLKQETWEKDGDKRSKIVVVADRISFPNTGKSEGGRSSGQSSESGRSPTNNKPSSSSQQSRSRYEDHEEIPF